MLNQKTTKPFCVLFLVALLVRQASAQEHAEGGFGRVQGKVTVSGPDDISGEIIKGRALNRYEMGGNEKAFEPYTLSERAVVYLESVPGNFTPPQNRPRLNQRDMVFHPLVLPVVVGTTVDFPNADPLFHNVFSLSQAKEFDLGRYPQGEKRSVTFDKPGVVSVYCEIHSYMFATILVLQNPYFAIPGEEGSFSIPEVPAGTYQISFWYGRKKVGTKGVTVTRNESSSVNFIY
jgi:plastocyanin